MPRQTPAIVRASVLRTRPGVAVLAVAPEVGIRMYYMFWFLMAAANGGRHDHNRPHTRLDLQGRDLREPWAIGLIVAGIVLLLRNVAPWFSDVSVWRISLAG